MEWKEWGKPTEDEEAVIESCLTGDTAHSCYCILSGLILMKTS